MEQRLELVPMAAIQQRAAAYEPRDFASALRGERLAVIAEVKQRTPRVGVLTADYSPAALVASYEQGGASAISVLTHQAAFGGLLGDLDAVRASTKLPILRKDFITDAYQVVEARAHGADAVLLIVAAMDANGLDMLLWWARQSGLAALVEVHDEAEVKTAIRAGARIIGVNHRDLNTFDVDLTLTERLRPHVPDGVLLVAESGIHGPADARRMREAGADAVLVGELLMRSADPGATIKALVSA